MLCIDLIITDQPNLFVDFGVHPSLDNHCQHQIIHGMINISVPPPPPFKRKIWYYVRAKKDQIKLAIENVDWPTIFSGLDVDSMTELFTSISRSIFSLYIPNKVITCDDRDLPFVTATLKSAVKRNHRVYNKYVKHGRKPDDWEYVRSVRNETSAKIKKPKTTTFLTWAKSYLILLVVSNPIGQP